MKQTISAFFITVSMAVMFLVACSDDSSDETLPREIITKVNSIYELGKCGDQNEGDTVYAQKEDADYYCHNENWIPVNESSSSAKSSSSKASSSSKSKDELNKFTDLCKASGGTAKDGACVCNKELCDVGAVCNTITGVCGNRSKPSDISSDSKKSSSSVASSSSKPSSSSKAPTFADLCKASGGTTKDGACVCNDEICDEGAVCNTITGACGNQSKPIEISSESKSSSSSASAPTFADLCKASGGTAKDGACVCKSTACDEGVLCNTKSKECANKDALEKECSDSYKNSCSNSPANIGIVKECVKGVIVNRSCGLVSCNEKGTDCGECLDDVQTCTEDKKFHATVSRCENGKKVSESCGDFSCDPRDNSCGECTNYRHSCVNDEEEKGTVYECVAGEAKKAVTICGNKSCRTDKPICGECLNGELKCDNDINNNAIMYRCVDGQWERLRNKFDPLDKEYYKCPVACREGTDPQKMETECDIDQCSDCDPCWGEPMGVAPSNPNPCYDEERCKKILAEEDPDYPPFRSFETKQKWKELIPSKKMAAKTVHGYNWNNHKPVSSPDERVEDFEFDLTNETRHVTCNIQGTYFGVCHNSLQTCINTSYHTGGYMVVCANGELVDEEKEGDGIACHCEDLGNKNAYGCCYTRSACFKQTNWATTRCALPKNEDDD